jgi:para-aminobenzoate synthetase/4-amino-4-deoxychorismate lyase
MPPLEDMPGPYVLLETDRRDLENTRSFLFSEPVRVLRLEAGGDPRDFFGALDAAAAEGLWAAGYFAYELGYLMEPRLASLAEHRRPAGPLAWVGLFERPSEAPPPRGGGFEISHLRSGTTWGEYRDAVDRIKSHIADGQTYQVNYTFKQEFDLDGPPEALYAELRRRQSASYSGCLFDGERTVISLSPELFVRRHGDIIRVRPMKGTARRGATETEDAELAAWLAGDAKNRAENVMIVDMVRNDLGRIATPAGVRVSALFEVERYQTLYQMTSTVEAEVPRETSWFDVFRALFPCASVTGAPKIRTMELIAELEKHPRGIYTGAIGYIAPGGEACFNVAIRTIVVDRGGRAEMGIGSGVVFDSNARAEYEECLWKGRFLTCAARGFELVETMRLEGGSVYLRDRHLKRLESSAAHFGFVCEVARISGALDQACDEHPKGTFKIRLLLDAGGSVSLSCIPLAPPPQRLRLKLSRERIDPAHSLLYHKTTQRPLYRREHELAVREGYDEVLFLNKDGEVCEGSMTNIFAEIDGELFSPPVSCGLLPGTLREELMSRRECRERVLDLSSLRHAHRVYAGNSVTGLVVAVLDV